MATPRTSLCYTDPDWQIEVRRPCAANGRQYVIEIDGVSLLIKEDFFPRFLHDLRVHLEGALSGPDRRLVGAEKERTTIVRRVR